MKFSEMFRERYRIARNAAKANKKEETLAELNNLYQLFAQQILLQNGDRIVVKAKLNYWQNIFGNYIDIIKSKGLQDKRVQKFFGLIDDFSIPSLGDYLNGEVKKEMSDEYSKEKISNNNIDMSGIVESPMPVENATQKQNPTDQEMSTEEGDSRVMPNPVALGDYSKDIYPKTTLDIPEESNGQNIDAYEKVDVNKVENTTATSFTPNSLEEFIGQQHIIKILLREIAIAKAKNKKYLDNILLFGNPGLGKTTLMQLIAKSLGVRFEWMDCSQYRNSQQSLKALQNFLMKVARENEPVVIALDEIHMLSEELQSSLLTLLNSRVYVSPPDSNGLIKRIPIENFTFIAATTDDDKVMNTIKDRCLRLKFQMVDYTPEELRRIYRNKVAAKQLTISDDAIENCLPRSRGSIRYVNAFVDGLETMLYDDNGKQVSTNIDLETTDKFFAERGIDPIGLEKKDLEILKTIQEDSSGAISAETLSSRVGLTCKKYLSEYEPYLLKIGFVSISGRGRILTEKALHYLKP